MKDKVVIITGASSGIGKALALEFATLGSKVVITGRNEERLKEVGHALDQLGAPNLCLKLDVAKESDNECLVNETVKAFGGIDILINNAGISMRALLEEMDIFQSEEDEEKNDENQLGIKIHNDEKKNKNYELKQKEKYNTARVVVWNDLKVTNSFTLEMSMHAKESLMVNKRRKI